MNELEVEEVFRDAAGAIDVPVPPIEAVVAESRARRRHRQRRALTVGSALAVLALGTWWGTRPDTSESELGGAEVTRVENPAEIAWWANDVLHLDHVAIALPPLTDLTEVTGGAVYADRGGAIVRVDEDGVRSSLGTKVADAPLVVSDEKGWASWVDPREGAELVVHDLTSRQVLVRHPVPEGTEPIALDQDRVFYATPDGAFSLVLPDGGGEEVRESHGLLDVASATRVRPAGADTIEMVQPFFSISFVRPGVGAQLSADGNHVLTRTEDARSVHGTVHVYDTRSGEELPSGLTDKDFAIVAGFGPEGAVTYVVARAEDEPQADDFVRLSFAGPLELRTCWLYLGSCRVVAKFPSTGATPVLSR